MRNLVRSGVFVRERGAAGKQKKYQLPAAAECAALVAAKARLDRASPAVWLDRIHEPRRKELWSERGIVVAESVRLRGQT